MEMYNHSTKMEYIDTVKNEDVQKLFEHLFRKSKNAEELYNKDLYSFNLPQLEEVIKNLNPKTVNSMTNIKSRLNLYITWAIQNGRRESNINPLHGTTKDWGKRLIDKVSKRYLSELDIIDLTEDLLNAQDKALIQCIFEGISGRSMSELISLNINNIDWSSNTVAVKDERDESPRKLTVSDRCAALIKKAYEQTIYTAEDTGNTKELVENEGAVFKNTLWRTTENKQVTRGNPAKRLYIIKEKHSLDALSVNTISNSGKIKMAADLYKQTGKLDKEELTMIADTFNMAKMTVGEYSYYDTTKMRNYINNANLSELYDLDINN